jgi:outer membrane protein assembly factor BamB
VRRRIMRGLGIVALVGVGVVSSSILLQPARPAGAALPKSAASLHVVGGPVSVGNRAVVIYVNSARNLYLAGIDPVSDKVIWQYPYSATGVTPGVALTPSAIGNMVMDVSPAGTPKNPLVRLSGINAPTGQVVWRSQGSFIPTDAASPCALGKYFCIPGYNEDGSSSLLLIDPTTGTGQGLLNGPFREMGTDLYQTDASKPTLEQVSPGGTEAWHASVASLFGPAFSPDYGWVIIQTATLDVGSFEPIVKGNGYDVSDEKTMGIDLATGNPVWSLTAEYDCGGSLFFVTSQVACQYGGVLRKPAVHGKTPSYKGLTIALTGFDASTGSVTWRVPVRNVSAIMNGAGLPFRDDTHVVVTLSNGHSALLNTSNGTMGRIAKGEIFWCEEDPTYKANAPTGYSYEANRTSTSLYFGCTANGKASKKVPNTTPESVGIKVDGIFAWPAPGGLRTRVVGIPQSIA